MNKLKEFWPLLMNWYEDGDIDSKDMIIDWMEDFIKDPDGTLNDLKRMEQQYMEDMESLENDEEEKSTLQ